MLEATLREGLHEAIGGWPIPSPGDHRGVYDRVPDIRLVCEEDAMILEETDGSRAPGSILREFTASYHELTLVIREDFRLSDPLFK